MRKVKYTKPKVVGEAAFTPAEKRERVEGPAERHRRPFSLLTGMPELAGRYSPGRKRGGDRLHGAGKVLERLRSGKAPLVLILLGVWHRSAWTIRAVGSMPYSWLPVPLRRFEASAVPNLGPLFLWIRHGRPGGALREEPYH